MHRLIAEQAGHHAVAELMTYVDHGDHELERLDAERRMEAKRLSRCAERSTGRAPGPMLTLCFLLTMG